MPKNGQNTTLEVMNKIPIWIWKIFKTKFLGDQKQGFWREMQQLFTSKRNKLFPSANSRTCV
jgi:hypothetical protein